MDITNFQCLKAYVRTAKLRKHQRNMTKRFQLHSYSIFRRRAWKYQCKFRRFRIESRRNMCRLPRKYQWEFRCFRIKSQPNMCRLPRKYQWEFRHFRIQFRRNICRMSIKAIRCLMVNCRHIRCRQQITQRHCQYWTPENKLHQIRHFHQPEPNKWQETFW